MKERYFVVTDNNTNTRVLDLVAQFAKEREEVLEQFRDEFDLTGFVFDHDGYPRYFLKPIYAEFDDSRFSPGRVNRTGTDFLCLEPTDPEILERCSGCRVITFTHALLRCLPHAPQTHLDTEPSPEVKLVEDKILLKVLEYNDLPYKPSVKLAEITEAMYNSPNLEKLNKLV